MTEKFSRIAADKELAYALDANHHRSVRAVTLQRALAELNRLRAEITARDERARQCVEVLAVKISNPSGEPFDELSQAVQVISMNHANDLMARDKALKAAEDALMAIQFTVKHREDDREVCYDFCNRCKIEAALSRIAALQK